MKDGVEAGAILQRRLPDLPWMSPPGARLPGTAPIAPADWLQRDDAFAAQMGYRDRLLAEKGAAVCDMLPDAGAAACELRDVVLSALAEAPGYRRDGDGVVRPDGVRVPLDGPPLATAGRLVQEDLCLLDKPGGADEHRLIGAVLCFPSNWTLAQKLGRPLSAIHLPVPVYAEYGSRVQRMFDLVRPGAPLMRANLLGYAASELHSPRNEFDRHSPDPQDVRFVRSERQTILRLPQTGAVVFSIHTYLVAPEALSPVQRARIAEIRPWPFVRDA